MEGVQLRGNKVTGNQDKDPGSNSNRNLLKNIFGGADKKRLSKEVDSKSSNSFSPFTQTRKQVRFKRVSGWVSES